MVWMMAAALAAEIPPLVEAAPTEPVPGATLTWTAEGCALKLRATNTGTAPIVIDWTQSTLTEAGAPSVGLVPGTSSAYSVQVNIPPTVAPVGGYAEVYVFRRDQMSDATKNACTYRVPSDLTLSVKIGDGWALQQIAIRPDEAALAKAKADAEALLRATIAEGQAASKRALAEKCDHMESTQKSSTAWAWITGLGGLALGSAGFIAGATDPDVDSRAGEITIGVIALGGGGTMGIIFGVDAAKQARLREAYGCPS